ncbi:glycoside hydrolase family 47 protein [Dothidotthia symphoricarpi CBS 119687]|uniref:alpha-1,2-Mannosidase n=1 Tax=Dothidotthia symphoricarpi CBS 119687 TaxID=1392245 RepID=A0A6A6A0G4_9PLEO|nr:glycoside hydrolase family 47 protein [Dothidotthia symphoricarpi CBS 119687]KAF2125016.1 glycoside hydrolase family 47 protein [Dothidotthia symphoricarpi CBS 119687]
MPSFRRWGKSKFEANPESTFKLLAAVLVITLYLLIKEFSNPILGNKATPASGAQIQYAEWNGTGKAQEGRADKVRSAMQYTFWKYREHAWGRDDILPVSGGNSSTRNGWGGFIVDSASTLALMGLWDELELSVEHILGIDFTVTDDLVDPFETTTRYLGGLLSLVDLYDAGLIPEQVMDDDARDLILEHAVTLAVKLGPAYDTPTGMPWPRVDFNTNQGVPEPLSIFTENPGKQKYDHPATSPAQTGSSILENRVLTRLTGDSIYAKNSTLAWAPLVWSKWTTPWPGMVDSPIDIVTGAPLGRARHWDDEHASYYEYLLKMTLLAPPADPYLDVYKQRFLASAYSLRKRLSSRSASAPNHTMQHLFLGRHIASHYENQQSHTSCAAPGTLLLAAKHLNQPYLRSFALALLEACRHTYTSTPSNIGPEAWSWTPKFSYTTPFRAPASTRETEEWAASGFWSEDPAFKGGPQYVASLFYAWRVTGQLRYREWAWEAFSAMEEYCKAPYGYAQLADVYRVQRAEWSSDGDGRWIDVQGRSWAQTLKYLWLTFGDSETASLDNWVFSTGGHVFRMIR